VKLVDLGELSIIDTILRPRYKNSPVGDFGDDVATLVKYWEDGVERHIVATTDPCPVPPVGVALGYDDYYYWGWLLSAVNLSDLAASGAKPLSILTSLELPNDMEVDDFERILDGVDDCASSAGAKVVGGNLKDASKISMTATAIGSCAGGPLGRVGCRPGDVVAVMGDMGRFWAGVIAHEKEISLNEDHLRNLRDAVLLPKPYTEIGQRIHAGGYVVTCMDNSDGLYSSLATLSRLNHVGFDLNEDGFTYPASVEYVAGKTSLDPIRFSLGWGDMQLVCTVRPEDLGRLKEDAASCSVPISVLGTVVEGNDINLNYRGERGRLMPLRSERFTQDSMFTAGLQGYAEQLSSSLLIS
jgi:thiamine-monophosphate kinase